MHHLAKTCHDNSKLRPLALDGFPAGPIFTVLNVTSGGTPLLYINNPMPETVPTSLLGTRLARSGLVIGPFGDSCTMPMSCSFLNSEVAPGLSKFRGVSLPTKNPPKLWASRGQLPAFSCLDRQHSVPRPTWTFFALTLFD